jgi:CRP-like cAMP-binding protein
MTNTDVFGYGTEQAVTRALQQVQIFADVEATEIVWIARRAHRRRVPRGSTVLQQEDRGTTAFVIISGSADVLLESEDGRQFIVARLGPGDHFGEMSLLDGEPRSATVVATSDAELLVLTREAFLEELEQHPELMRQMLVTLSRRIRVTDAQVASLAFGDTAARLARLLVQNARREHDVLVVHAVQEQLAAMAGTTRQTVGRIFGEWRRAGYIRTGRSSTVILRPEALEQIIR